MPEVYYYIPADKSDHIVECGLKLSVWFDKEVLIEGVMKKCISALLSPKDDMNKFTDNSLRCIRMELPSEYCYVGDKYLFELGRDKPELMNLYYKSVIPLENYIFGSYRLPECLVTTTVIAEQIHIVNKAQDIPVLFNNSEELYLSNLLEFNKEIYKNFEDMILYCFYTKLSELGIFVKIEDKDKGMAVFIENFKNSGDEVKNVSGDVLSGATDNILNKVHYAKEKVYIVKIPDFNNIINDKILTDG